MAKKPKYPRFVTPKGIAIYPSLTKPDYGTDEYPNPDGTFKTNLKLTAADAEVLIAKLKPLHDEAVAEGKKLFKDLKPATKKKLGDITINPLFEDVFDEDENETGEKVFKFKRKYSGTTKKGESWTASIDLFDAKLQPFPKATSIWGGSEIKVSFEARPYFIPGTGACGLSLSLLGAQVINLVGPGQRSAASHGFEAEEGGYEAPAKAGSEYEEDPEDAGEGGEGEAEDGADF